MSKALESLETELHAQWVLAMDGDAHAYRQVLKSLSHYLRGFLRRRVERFPGDVEDIVQEVILAIHLKRHTFLVGQPFTAWVHVIARHKMIDHFRARKHELQHDNIEDWADMLMAEPDARPGEAVREVEQALALLPEKQRTAIECTRLQGLSIDETASMTGQSVAAVKVNIHRGLKFLASRHASL